MSREATLIRSSLEPEDVEGDWTLDAERSGWEQSARSDRLTAGTTEAEGTVAGRPVLWVEPDDVSANAPVVVYAHGGGLTAGSPRTHRAFASRLAAGCQARLLLVDYRLLPDEAFPAPLDDVVAVVDELVSSGRSPAGRIVLAGDSSGAALAVSAACVMRDRRRDPVAGIVSLSGAFDATLGGESIDAGRDPQLCRLALERWQRTISTAVDLRDPLLSPVFASLHHLPPSLLIAGGDDIWLSDSVRLADEVVAANGSVRLQIVDGMWHVWPMYGEFPEADAAVAEIAQFVDRVAS